MRARRPSRGGGLSSLKVDGHLQKTGLLPLLRTDTDHSDNNRKNTEDTTALERPGHLTVVMTLKEQANVANDIVSVIVTSKKQYTGDRRRQSLASGRNFQDGRPSWRRHASESVRHLNNSDI